MAPIANWFWLFPICMAGLISKWILACPIPLVTAHFLYSILSSAQKFQMASAWRMLQQYSILLQGVPAMTILMSNEPVMIKRSNQLKYHQAHEGWKVTERRNSLPPKLLLCFFCGSIHLTTVPRTAVHDPQWNFLLGTKSCRTWIIFSDKQLITDTQNGNNFDQSLVCIAKSGKLSRDVHHLGSLFKCCNHF
jgi:hypothetical protein